MSPFLTLVGSYLGGAIPFGYVIARWRGVDIFSQGSGNIGATNVGRVLGWRLGVLVFLLDFAKGALPPLFVLIMLPAPDGVSLAVGAGLAAFLGHMFPVYLRFRGGKGVATGTGVVTVLLPGPAGAALLVWLAMVTGTRFVSLASLVAAGALCLFQLFLTAEPFTADNRILTLFCFVAAALVCVRHRSNLTRLWHGTESRLPETPAMHTAGKVIHVLALGLWFGSAVFFSFVAAPVIFQTFQSPEHLPIVERDAWVPLLKNFDEKAWTRLAGAAVGPIFPWYYLLQGICGLLTVLTALTWSWSENANRLHRWRGIILMLALAMVLAGWPLAQKVGGLRAARYSTDVSLAASAQAAFGTWHLFSLLLNLVTIVLVAVALGMAASLPAKSAPAPKCATPPQGGVRPPHAGGDLATPVVDRTGGALSG